MNREARVRGSMLIAEAVLAVAKGDVPNNVVNTGILKTDRKT